jgi:hypothetical protein
MQTPGNWKTTTWIVTVAALLLAGGCAARPPRVTAPRPMPKYPWFEAKNICVFRLGNGTLPQTADELSEAMSASGRMIT